MIEIDGDRGGGGGQVLRSALALSLVTSKPFHIVNIRARRTRPGLMRPHLAAVLAAVEVGKAEVAGAEVSSRELVFRPGAVRPGEHHFSVGTAGSTTLVFQTVFPALALAERPSTLVLEGGTHNPLAPTFEFIDRVYLPLVGRMGPQCAATLEKPGFYPAGGGRWQAEIQPSPSFARLELESRGQVRNHRAIALVSRLPRTIGERELATLQAQLGWPSTSGSVESVRDAVGPGNVVWAEVESEHVTELFEDAAELGKRQGVTDAEGRRQPALRRLGAGLRQCAEVAPARRLARCGPAASRLAGLTIGADASWLSGRAQGIIRSSQSRMTKDLTSPSKMKASCFTNASAAARVRKMAMLPRSEKGPTPMTSPRAVKASSTAL
jgi:RNA 3'-terminal phosphate cyclase (ATP)